MENECILTRGSHIKEQAQPNEKMLHESHQHVKMKESKTVTEKTHKIRSFIIPKTPKLKIIS